MAQLRQDFQIFVDLDTQILVVGPDNAKQFADYWHQNHLPYPGLPDPEHSILKRYGQEVNLFKLGRMPAQVLVDKSGMARFVHYGNSMSDIPDDEELFEIIQTLNEPEGVR